MVSYGGYLKKKIIVLVIETSRVAKLAKSQSRDGISPALGRLDSCSMIVSLICWLSCSIRLIKLGLSIDEDDAAGDDGEDDIPDLDDAEGDEESTMEQVD